MSRLGKMPNWQKWFVLFGMLSCSVTGISYLLGLRQALSWHGITAMVATLALGSILPFHLRSGLKARQKLWSGITQLGSLVILIISGAALYYGPEETRDASILIHWLIGLLFFAIFILHAALLPNRKSPR